MLLLVRLDDAVGRPILGIDDGVGRFTIALRQRCGSGCPLRRGRQILDQLYSYRYRRFCSFPLGS